MEASDGYDMKMKMLLGCSLGRVVGLRSCTTEL